MKTILITGGAGFIGANLIKNLVKDPNNYIVCIDDLSTGSIENIEKFKYYSNYIFQKHNIIDPIQLPVFQKIDEIYHLACPASPDKYKADPLRTINTSIIGTQNVLNICLMHKSRMLFTSTSEIYGDPLVHPQPETYYGNVNTVGERSCYDEGKRAAETIIYEFRKKYDLDIKIVRLFNTYGPKMDINDGRVITNFIKQIMKNEPLIVYGDGKQTRSFCYIDDMIEALILTMKSDEKGPMNLGNPDCEFTLNDLIIKFEELINKELEVKYISKTEDDPTQRKPIITKANNVINWYPKVKLEEGLEKTIKYFIDLSL